ncbi:patatin-like phospholipase family protein [Nocardia salmonicida]
MSNPVERQPTIRVLAGSAGRYLPMMAGMLSGAIDSVEALRASVAGSAIRDTSKVQPVVLGVSGGAIAAAAAALGMTALEMREIAVHFPDSHVLGPPSMRSLIARRTLYPAADVRAIAQAVVGDRSFADFALSDGRFLRSGGSSSLYITVYSAQCGTLVLPRDLPQLGVDDMLVADALVAATRIPGALPAARGLDDLFDGAVHHRVPYELFLPHPALVLDLYRPRPYRSLGGLALPAINPRLPMIPVRPRPFRDAAVRERTIFGNVPYGSSFTSPALPAGELFDQGRLMAMAWMESRSASELLAIADPHTLGLTESHDLPLSG